MRPSMQARRFCSKWNRSATCRACGAPRSAPCAYNPQRSRLMTSTPGCRSSQRTVPCRTVREHVDDLMPLQVDQPSRKRFAFRRGAVADVLAPAPVVDAEHADSGRNAGGRMPLELAQDRAVAGRHAKARRQPLAGAATGGVAQQPHGSGDAASSPREWCRDGRETLGEGLPLARRIATSPAAQPQVQRHPRSLHRQVLQAPMLPVSRAVAHVPQSEHVCSSRPHAETCQVPSFGSTARTRTSGPKAQPKFICVPSLGSSTTGDRFRARRVSQTPVMRSVAPAAPRNPITAGAECPRNPWRIIHGSGLGTAQSRCIRLARWRILSADV